MKIYFHTGWKYLRVEGIVQGYVPQLVLGTNTDTKAIVLVTHSDSPNFRKGKFVQVSIDDLHHDINGFNCEYPIK